MTIPESRLFSLKQLREAKNYSQQAMAEALGVSQAQYARIEQGIRQPTISQLHCIAVLYETSMDFVFHCFFRQAVEFFFPDESLKYCGRMAVRKDLACIKRLTPLNELQGLAQDVCEVAGREV